MGEPIEERRGHFGVAEHGGPLGDSGGAVLLENGSGCKTLSGNSLNHWNRL
jgi:hypothetical protein